MAPTPKRAPNLYELSGTRLKVTYSSSSIAGKPLLTIYCVAFGVIPVTAGRIERGDQATRSTAAHDRVSDRDRAFCAIGGDNWNGDGHGVLSVCF